ncbi:LADA_0E08746g1_1 [Lachancea dasiensis]|uniref:LADA_0E08746g1_1 n=1 Tax=Lachancea dasiensis TaxID=1072105 RepID=A0A1G4JDF7_9SACH|nr:LADA_0E08746g1_1 [Lachancea dasiensis]
MYVSDENMHFTQPGTPIRLEVQVLVCTLATSLERVPVPFYTMDNVARYVSVQLTSAKRSWDEHGLARVDPLSFLLGSAVTVLCVLMEPVARALVGGVLVGVLTLVKYAVLITAIGLCGYVLTVQKHEAPAAGPTPNPADRSSHEKAVREQFLQGAAPVEDDFEVVGYNELQVHPERPPKAVKRESTYEKFVKQARG